MTEASTERAIGRLEGELDAVIQAVDENKKESAAGRKCMYEELEEIRSQGSESRQQISASKAKIEEIVKKMDDAEKTLGEIKRWKERGIGMGMAFGLLGFSAAAGAQFIWKWVSAKLGI